MAKQRKITRTPISLFTAGGLDEEDQERLRTIIEAFVSGPAQVAFGQEERVDAAKYEVEHLLDE